MERELFGSDDVPTRDRAEAVDSHFDEKFALARPGPLQLDRDGVLLGADVEGLLLALALLLCLTNHGRDGLFELPGRHELLNRAGVVDEMGQILAPASEVFTEQFDDFHDVIFQRQ